MIEALVQLSECNSLSDKETGTSNLHGRLRKVFPIQRGSPRSFRLVRAGTR